MAVKKQIPTRENKKNTLDKVLSRDYTIHLGAKTRSTLFKKRASRAMLTIKNFARKQMHTPIVKVDAKVNKFIWSNGRKNPPSRIRVRLARKRQEDEDAVHPFYTLVSFVPVDTFKGLLTANVDEDASS